MAIGSCPTCGTPRVGSFRYCRSCGLDYDSIVPNAPTPASVIDAAVPEEAPVGLPITDDVQQNDVQQNEVPQNEVQPQPAGDVIVIQIRHLKLLAGAIAGGLIGSMLAGAIVVPWFGEEGVLLGSLVAIVMIVVSAWLGLWFMQARARRRPAGRSETPG